MECDLSVDSLLKFVDCCYLGKGRAGQLCKSYRKQIVRAVGILPEHKLKGISAFSQHFDRKNYSCPEPFKAYTEKYYTQKNDEGMSESWKISYTAEMRKFVSFLLDASVPDFSLVTPATISAYIAELKDYSPHMFMCVLGRLRGFFRWMYSNNYLEIDKSAYFPSANRCSFPSHIPAVWKPDEIQKILSVIDRENPIGKRDYAVLLLLSKTGLRASDALFLEY